MAGANLVSVRRSAERRDCRQRCVQRCLPGLGVSLVPCWCSVESAGL